MSNESYNPWREKNLTLLTCRPCETAHSWHLITVTVLGIRSKDTYSLSKFNARPQARTCLGSAVSWDFSISWWGLWQHVLFRIRPCQVPGKSQMEADNPLIPITTWFWNDFLSFRSFILPLASDTFGSSTEDLGNCQSKKCPNLQIIFTRVYLSQIDDLRQGANLRCSGE